MVQLMMMPLKLMLLPPICSVTSVVPGDSALSCGGLLPSGTDSGLVMFVVSAPWQLTSVNEVGPMAAATRCGKLCVDRAHPAGEPVRSGMSGPAV